MSGSFCILSAYQTLYVAAQYSLVFYQLAIITMSHSPLRFFHSENKAGPHQNILTSLTLPKPAFQSLTVVHIMSHSANMFFLM